MHAGANALFEWKYHWCFMYGISDDEKIEFYFHSYCSYCWLFFSLFDAFVVGDAFFCNFDYDWNKTQFSDKQLSSIHKSIHTKHIFEKKNMNEEGTQLLNIQSWLNKFFYFIVYVELLFVYILYISNNQNAVNYKLKYKLKLNINFWMDEKNKYENKGTKIIKLLLCKSIWPASFQMGMKFMLRLGS